MDNTMSAKTTKGFFDYKPHELNFIPFDIETTGFKASDGDFVTNIVLHNNDTYHIWINTDGNEVDAGELNEEVLEGSDLDNILLYICESEKNLLQNVHNYLRAETDNSTVLTAFNGETFRGDTDFDIPFLRTRCLRNGLPWILSGNWYTDSFEVFSQKNRFDTTVKAEPNLDSMKKSDIVQFIDDFDFDIHHDKMKKAEIVHHLRYKKQKITFDMIENWAEDNVVGDTPETYADFTASELKSFIDDKSIDIPYGNTSKDALIQKVREQNYSEEMLVEWHEETGRSIGTMTINDLDGIHEVMVEDKLDNDEWGQNLPFDVEVFEPFDPYVSSGEAVTGFLNGDYAGVILHCFADVARTVNLTRMMAEYAPMSDYKPKVL